MKKPTVTHPFARRGVGRRAAACALSVALVGSFCVPTAALAASQTINPAGGAVAATTLGEGVFYTHSVSDKYVDSCLTTEGALELQSNNSMFKPCEGVVVVDGGRAKASFSHSSYEFLFLGTQSDYEEALAAGDITKDPRYIKGEKTTILKYDGKTLSDAYRYTFELEELNKSIPVVVKSPSSGKILERDLCFSYDSAKQAIAAVNVDLTVSDQGGLAFDEDAAETTAAQPMAHRGYVAVDLDSDGTVTYAEALTAAHAKFLAAKPDSFGVSGGMINKIWGTETTSVGVLDNGAFTLVGVDEHQVANNDCLYAFVYTDNVSWTDSYAYFDKDKAAVAPGGSVTLSLSNIVFDESYNPQSVATTDTEGAVSVGYAALAADGSTFAPVADLENDGTVTLDFDEPGSYVVTATGFTSAGAPITAPACVVNVVPVALDGVYTLDATPSKMFTVTDQVLSVEDGQAALSFTTTTASGGFIYLGTAEAAAAADEADLIAPDDVDKGVSKGALVPANRFTIPVSGLGTDIKLAVKGSKWTDKTITLGTELSPAANVRVSVALPDGNAKDVGDPAGDVVNARVVALDGDSNGTLSCADALFAAHKKYLLSTEGFGVSPSGVVTKTWGVDRFFGCWLNGAKVTGPMEWSKIEDGDVLEFKPLTAVSAPKISTAKYTGKKRTALKNTASYTVSGTVSATNVGTYSARVTPTALYCWKDGSSSPVTVKWTIAKASNKVSAKVTKKVYKKAYKKKLKKSYSFSIGAKSSFGKVKYKVTKGSKKYISVSKSGKVTMKKGAKTGTYYVKAYVSGTSNYASASKTIVIKVYNK